MDRPDKSRPTMHIALHDNPAGPKLTSASPSRCQVSSLVPQRIASATRRRWLGMSAGLALGGLEAGVASAASETGRSLVDAEPAAGSTHAPLHFPRDLGAHLDYRTEWWYLTGHAAAGQRHFGFQVTFFRSRVPGTQQLHSRLAARQLLFAHAAITDLQDGHLLHDQRIVRWNGLHVDAQRPTSGATGSAQSALLPHASLDDTDVSIGDWSLQHVGDAYRVRVQAEGFALQLDCHQTPGQPLLLQGDGGLSRKGPMPGQTSWYYSIPQLAVQGALRVGKERLALDPLHTNTILTANEPTDTNAPQRHTWGRAWLDHEWSNELLDRDAAGWDWLGMNLFDGSALTAFRLRRADGSTLWTGGSFRDAAGQLRVFAPGETRFTPGKRWTSPRSQASYPVEWSIETPAGNFTVRALLDDQEMDSRASTGAIYWEGVSALEDVAGAPIGRGYLEMAGYSAALRVS